MDFDQIYKLNRAYMIKKGIIEQDQQDLKKYKFDP